MSRLGRRLCGLACALGWTTTSSIALAQWDQAPPTPATAEPTTPDGSAPAPTSPSPPAPPPAYAPPPGYKLVPIQEQPAQTHYDVQYPQPRGALPPGMELPYDDGQPIPPGYHLVERNRRGLIIAGSILVGVGWSLGVTGAVAADYDDKSGFLLVPVLGPWLMLAAGGAKDPPCTSGNELDLCQTNATLRAVLVLDGLLQAGGAAMFVLGFTNPSKHLVRDDVTVGVAPMTFGRNGRGLGVVGAF